jgi:endoglucanase
VVVRARDAAGNQSAASAATTFTTSSTGGGGGCSAAYSITNTWDTGFQGSVVVTNNGTTASTGWTVTWTYANGQVISQLWGGLLTQTGASVSVRNESYNGALAPNATATFGFLASHGATNATPVLTCTRTP